MPAVQKGFSRLPAVGRLRHEQEGVVPRQLDAVGEGQARQQHRRLPRLRVVAQQAPGVLRLQQNPVVIPAAFPPSHPSPSYESGNGETLGRHDGGDDGDGDGDDGGG
jgi:hypothetical protein